MQDLAAQGLSFGVHTVITTPRWTELKSRVRDYLGTKVEFRLGDVNETQIDRITREIPANRPGRAISTEKHHLMIGVPRLDGVHSADNLVEAITDGGEPGHRGPAHRAGAAGVRVLPERIYLHELDPNPPGPDTDYRTRWTIPIGVRETDLSVAYAHMHTTPHLLIFGAPKSGKTRIAHAVAQAICARNSPQQVRFMLADYRSGLLDAVPREPPARRGCDQPQQHDARRSHQGPGGQPAEAAAAGRPDHRATTVPVLVERIRRRAAGRRLAHDRGAAGGMVRRWRRWRRYCRPPPTSGCTSS